MIEKVGVYCRLSDEDKDKINKNDDSDSIVNQRSMCLKYAVQNNWNVVDIYSDDDFSGANTYRPDFQRLLRDCESGKINLVLRKSQSRFSRDMQVIEEYLHNKFVEWGVRFVGIVDNADTNVASNKKSRQINGLINEWYLEDLSQNIRKSLKNKRDDGLFMGSFAPYGYEKDPEDKHKLIIDPVASEVVKSIFSMYADGYGYWKICEHLNNNNIPPRSIYKRQKGSKFVCYALDYDKARWNPDTIYQILRQEVYIGHLVQGKMTKISYKNKKHKKVPEKEWSRTENAHEPIIDIDTWNKVQKILGKHTKPDKKGIITPFTKKVYCSCCDKAFMRNVYKVKGESTGKRAYLQCKGAKKLHICDNNKAIRMSDVENILLNEINKLLSKYYDKENLKDLYSKASSKEKDNQHKIKILLQEKNELISKAKENVNFFKNLYEDKVRGVITEDMFLQMSSDYQKDLDNSNKRIEKIEKEIDELNVKKQDKKQAEVILKKYKKIKEINRTIIEEFVDKIYIGKYDKISKSRDIEIIWNFEF